MIIHRGVLTLAFSGSHKTSVSDKLLYLVNVHTWNIALSCLVFPLGDVKKVNGENAVFSLNDLSAVHK